jgi:VCBS repeat-containing protein
MLPGEVVTVVCSNTALNGTFVIKTVGSTTFTLDSTQSNITSASATGTVTNGVAVPAGNGNRIHLQRA